MLAHRIRKRRGRASGPAAWIAGSSPAMTKIEIRSRDATSHLSYDTPRLRAVTTGLDPVVHAEDQQANAGGSIRKRRFSMDCLA
jgi:hypothetical protein